MKNICLARLPDGEGASHKTAMSTIPVLISTATLATCQPRANRLDQDRPESVPQFFLFWWSGSATRFKIMINKMVQIKTVLTMLAAVTCRAKKVDPNAEKAGGQQEQANTTDSSAKIESNGRGAGGERWRNKD